MAEWIGVTKKAINKYLRKTVDNTLRSHPFWMMVQQKGNISYNNSGLNIEWPVKMDRAVPQPYSDNVPINAPRQNYHQRAVLPWASYAVGRGITVREQLLNRGNESLVPGSISDLYEDLASDWSDWWPQELYVDGLATAEPRVHGLGTFLGVTGSAQYTAPSDTYAGLVTTRSNYGGTISPTYPDGRSDPASIFWSPLIVNYTHNDWLAGTGTWKTTCRLALRAGQMYQLHLRDEQGWPDLITMTTTMLRQFKETLDDKERIIVGSVNTPIKLGFPSAVNFEGSDLISDQDCPAGAAYGMNFRDGADPIEVICATSQLWQAEENFEAAVLRNEYFLHSLCQMRFNPARVVYWKNIT